MVFLMKTSWLAAVCMTGTQWRSCRVGKLLFLATTTRLERERRRGSDVTDRNFVKATSDLIAYDLIFRVTIYGSRLLNHDAMVGSLREICCYRNCIWRECTLATRSVSSKYIEESLKLKIEMNSALLLNAMQFKKRPLPLLVLYYNGIPC